MPIRKFTVSNDPTIYEAWPDVVLTNGGKLICVFTECERHSDRAKSRIVLRESTDRGRSWSEKTYLTDVCPSDCYFNCARISRLRDGTLAIICDKMTRSEGINREALTSELHLWLSDPEGTEWRKKAVYPFVGIVPDKLLELECGRLIIAAHFNGDITNKLEQYLWYSDNGGESWSERITVAASPDYNLCEVSLLPIGDKLVALMRENSGVGEDILMTVSSDMGESWSEITHTPISAGHRPTSGILQDGRVMVTYRFIPSRGSQNVFAAIITTDALLSGDRTSRIRVVPLDYDRNPVPDIGYTGWAQFDDGEIYVVNYIKDDSEKAHIRGYSFYPSDIELPPSDFSDKNYF